jgi:hypothetical protein
MKVIIADNVDDDFVDRIREVVFYLRKGGKQVRFVSKKMVPYLYVEDDYGVSFIDKQAWQYIRRIAKIPTQALSHDSFDGDEYRFQPLPTNFKYTPRDRAEVVHDEYGALVKDRANMFALSQDWDPGKDFAVRHC